MPGTAYFDTLTLNAAFGKASMPVFTNVYLALFTASPTKTGSLASEVTGSNYARVLAPSLFAMASTNPSNAGVIVNQSTILFNNPSANWGTVSYIALMDSLTGGNMLIYSPLNANIVVNTNNQVMTTPSQLVFNAD